jgi:formate/nitrite transporter FocA (FNT family)
MDRLGCEPHNATMRTRKQLITAILAPILIGFIGLIHLSQQPRFQAFHNVDILQLIASGMCFGVALVAVVALIRGPRSTSGASLS